MALNGHDVIGEPRRRIPVGSRSLAVIHCEPAVKWQEPFAHKMAAGLKAVGIPSVIVRDRCRRDEGFPVLLGTTFWQGIERDGGEFLLVDRCQFGDTNRWVTLGWNGRGREADYRVPASYDASRWEAHEMYLEPWRDGRNTVLCGQIPHPLEWYADVAPQCDLFRPHPADDMNPTSLPGIRGWADVGKAVVLSSSVAVAAVMAGVPTVTMHPRCMAWDVTSHVPHETVICDREPWLHWLSWCQWSHDEIEQGIPHLWD